jgi:hypothetical protein
MRPTVGGSSSEHNEQIRTEPAPPSNNLAVAALPAHPNSIFITEIDGTFLTAAITPTHDRVTERKLLIGQ